MHIVLVLNPHDEIQFLKVTSVSRLLRDANHRVTVLSIAKKKTTFHIENFIEPFLSFNPLALTQMLLKLKPEVLEFFCPSALSQLFINACPSAKIIFHLSSRPNFFERIVIKKADLVILPSRAWLVESPTFITLPYFEKIKNQASNLIVISGSPSVWQNFENLLLELKTLQYDFPEYRICLLDEYQELVGIKRTKVLRHFDAEILSTPSVESRRQKIAQAHVFVISPLRLDSVLWTESFGLALASETPTVINDMQSSMCTAEVPSEYVSARAPGGIYKTLTALLKTQVLWTPPMDHSNELLRIY